MESSKGNTISIFQSIVIVIAIGIMGIVVNGYNREGTAIYELLRPSEHKENMQKLEENRQRMEQDKLNIQKREEILNQVRAMRSAEEQQAENRRQAESRQRAIEKEAEYNKMNREEEIRNMRNEIRRQVNQLSESTSVIETMYSYGAIQYHAALDKMAEIYSGYQILLLHAQNINDEGLIYQIEMSQSSIEESVRTWKRIRESKYD